MFDCNSVIWYVQVFILLKTRPRVTNMSTELAEDQAALCTKTNPVTFAKGKE